MKNVGEANQRNLDYQKTFSREKLFQRLVKSERPTLFDIGAHEGQSVEYLRKLFPQSRIYSFEPDPDSFRILKGKGYPDLLCFNLALADKPGVRSFFRSCLKTK